jgi:hypothetical protein
MGYILESLRPIPAQRYYRHELGYSKRLITLKSTLPGCGAHGRVQLGKLASEEIYWKRNSGVRGDWLRFEPGENIYMHPVGGLIEGFGGWIGGVKSPRSSLSTGRVDC